MSTLMIVVDKVENQDRWIVLKYMDRECIQTFSLDSEEDLDAFLRDYQDVEVRIG